jgi:membrane protein YdbS with pleckstrin-like domain
MGKKFAWRNGEQRVISVTPVARGLLLPVLATIIAAALIEYGAGHVQFLRSIHLILLLVFVVPCLFVVATRTWRWRSHKVHVTNQRIIVEGGVLHHQRSEVDLRDVLATRISQRFRERLTRRGTIALETRAGTMGLGVVHHPSALCRLIDLEREACRESDLAYDTVFDFDTPRANDFEVDSRHRRDSQ